MFYLEKTKMAIYAHTTLTQMTCQKHKLSSLTETSLLHQTYFKWGRKSHTETSPVGFWPTCDLISNK